jgi:hypothetical protein
VFAQALGQLLAADPGLANVVRVEIYGADPDSISRKALAALPAGVVREMGRLELDPATGKSGRERVLERMNAVDCLLLLHGTEPFCAEYIPSKLYEYLWTQRPILALVSENPQMQRMLAGEGHSVAPAADPQAVARTLAALLDRWRHGGLGDSGRPSPYTVQAAVRSLVAWGREAAARRGS